MSESASRTKYVRKYKVQGNCGGTVWDHTRTQLCNCGSDFIIIIETAHPPAYHDCLYLVLALGVPYYPPVLSS